MVNSQDLSPIFLSDSLLPLTSRFPASNPSGYTEVSQTHFFFQTSKPLPSPPPCQACPFLLIFNEYLPVRKIPWRREWLPTPVFLPGEFHGQRSLAGHNP